MLKEEFLWAEKCTGASRSDPPRVAGALAKSLMHGFCKADRMPTCLWTRLAWPTATRWIVYPEAQAPDLLVREVLEIDVAFRLLQHGCYGWGIGGS